MITAEWHPIVCRAMVLHIAIMIVKVKHELHNKAFSSVFMHEHVSSMPIYID